MTDRLTAALDALEMEPRPVRASQALSDGRFYGLATPAQHRARNALDNPYPAGTINHDAWGMGYEEGIEEAAA